MAQKITFKDAEFYFCTTPQNADLTQAEYEALTFIKVGGVGNVGNWSQADNMITYNLVSDDVSAKQKGYRDGGTPEIECAYDPDDAGQTALLAASETSDNYAAYLLLSSGEIWYARGVVGSPMRGDGGGEDFVLQRFPFGINTRLTIVAAP